MSGPVIGMNRDCLPFCLRFKTDLRNDFLYMFDSISCELKRVGAAANIRNVVVSS
jgi:hypothetical protein